MNFIDNVVKSSNALLKDRLNNPFGAKQASQSKSDEDQSSSQQINEDQTSSISALTTADHPTQPPDGTQANNQTSEPNGADKGSQFAAIAADAEAVTQKAVQGAKDIGSFLFSMANKAGQTVSQTAKQVKQAVESTSILTDFTREQQEFIKEHGGNIQAGELPWSIYANDESKANDMREQILSLSQDQRNFVRSPPSDSNFQYDPKQCYPIALSLLKEDPNLSKMRFELVPKLVNEDTFWCNYFYRVSLLKQMLDRGGDLKRQGWSSNRSSSGEGPDDIASIDEVNQVESISPKYTNVPATTGSRLSFVDKDLHNLESSQSRKIVAEADDLKNKLRELNIGSLDDCQDGNENWEEELQRDLQEFEVVSGDMSALDEEALDKEIMELKNSSKNTT